MRKLFYLFLFIAFSSCKPELYFRIKKSYNPEPQNTEVRILTQRECNKQYFENLGTMRISTDMFSKINSLDKILDYAQMQAKQYGGNAIEIIDQELPSTETYGLTLFFNPGHSITFNILRKRASVLPLIDNKLEQDTNPPRLIIYFQKSQALDIRRKRLDLIGDIIPIKEEILIDGVSTFRLNKTWLYGRIDSIGLGEHFVWVRQRDVSEEIPLVVEKKKDYYIRLRYSFTGNRVTVEAVGDDIGEFETSELRIE
jgi:hypothetical protein